MQRARDSEGREYRVVALTTLIAALGAMSSITLAIGGYALGHRDERNEILERLDERFQTKAEARVLNDSLSARIADSNLEIGRVRGVLEQHLFSRSR